MKIINADAIELFNNNPQKHIEAIGRICYKSENKITEDSHRNFIKNLFNNSHWAMLEHFRFILQVPAVIYTPICYIKSPYIICTNKDNRLLISASARGLLDAAEMVYTNSEGHFDRVHTIAIDTIIKYIVYKYGCDELFGCKYTPLDQWAIEVRDFSELTDYERMKHEWHSIKFTCDRGVSHELVRHRLASFAQESTRYCNYANGKFDGGITVIKPNFFGEDTEQYDLWKQSVTSASNAYVLLIASGVSPQQARTVLPNSLKTDIVVTATNEEWKHIIDLRYIGTTGQPHPQMVEIMNILINKCEWTAGLCTK